MTAILLALLLTVALIPATVRTASADVVTGQCGDSLAWSFNEETGVLTITGTGAMYGFHDYRAPWYENTPYILRVDLPDGLTAIGDNAFCDCTLLTELTVPEGVVRIGMAAFLNCAKLTKITLPNSLEEVETGAFDGAGLTDVYYYGTEADRAGIAIDNSANGNAPFLGAAWHYLPDVTLVWNANDVQFRGTTPYMVYRGSPCTPRFTLQFAGRETLGAAYYDFEYRENDRAGTGYVFVTFRNGYEGTLRGWFKIYLPATETTTVQNVDNGIALSWSAVPGAAGYVIYRRAWNATADGWTAFVRWNNTTGLNWTDEKVYAGTRYQYGIKAYFARRLDPVSGDMIGGNVGDNYNLGEVGPIRTMMRITTRTLQSVTGGTKQITAKWSPSALFAGYELQLATNAAFTQNVKTVQIKDPKAASKTVKNLKAKTTYYVRVRSFHVFENVTYYGAWSNVGSAKTK